MWWVLQRFSTTMITKCPKFHQLLNVCPHRALAPAGQVWLGSSKLWFSSRNEYLHWAHAVFTVVKEIDVRFRICNNLGLIGHSVFVTIPTSRVRTRVCVSPLCQLLTPSGAHSEQGWEIKQERRVLEGNICQDVGWDIHVPKATTFLMFKILVSDLFCGSHLKSDSDKHSDKWFRHHRSCVCNIELRCSKSNFGLLKFTAPTNSQSLKRRILPCIEPKLKILLLSDWELVGAVN